MDIKIDEECGKFKFRVCGILENNGKYLTVKINDNDFYCLPGGHVEMGEDTDTSILREMNEELGYPVKIKKLLAVNQNFFKSAQGKNFHEIGFYYVVEALDKNNVENKDYNREELDKGKIQHLEFKWFTKDQLKQIDFRPSFIANCLDKNCVEINITKD